MLTGCGLSYIDEGATDYRKIEINNTEDCRLSSADTFVELKRKNAPPATCKDKLKFNDNDKVVVRLISAYIRDYTEGPFSWLSDALDGQFYHRGEIAIVVNAFDFSNNKTHFNFPHKELSGEGRVIFYSGDVVEKQFLNFNNMPIYGPPSGGLRGIGLEIWVVELDLRDKLTGNILSAMAQYGSATPPPSFDSAILNSIGRSVLDSSDAHDTNLLYRLLLEPEAGSVFPRPFLEAGYYVFIRANFPRHKDIEWDSLELDINTGRLVYKEDRDKKYTKHNYLVINIDKSTGGDDVEVKNKKFNKLAEAIENKSNDHPVIILLVNRELDRLMELFDECGESCAKKGKMKLRDSFRHFWRLYVKPSLERQPTPLAQSWATLRSIQEKLQDKLSERQGGESGEYNPECIAFQDWWSHCGENQESGCIRRIRDDIERIITDNTCEAAASAQNNSVPS